MKEAVSNDYTLQSIELDTLQQGLIQALIYSDIFKYPLTEKELYERIPVSFPDFEKVAPALQTLVAQKIISSAQGYYFLGSEDNCIGRRIQGNKKARSYRRLARVFTRIIASFPFVKAVLLTGSLSKGIIEKKGDVDYFIITSPERLWLCRTLLIIFKKVFLLNSRKYFCVNYFIDTNNLEIQAHNIFTATEIATSIPAYNQLVCDDFYKSNLWYKTYFPNQQLVDVSLSQKKTFSPLKPLLEKIFAGKSGERLDDWCYHKTLNHWKKKHSNLDARIFEENFKSLKYISKHHPHGFQFRVTEEYERRIQSFEKQHKLSLR
jgi:hypothetical protein